MLQHTRLQSAGKERDHSRLEELMHGLAIGLPLESGAERFSCPYDVWINFGKLMMADIVDSATRSRMMSGIRSTSTKPEKLIRSLLHRRGLRFRINRRDLPGKPDIVFSSKHAVIFVHGCFWHGHNCPLFKMPATRTEFWAAKITGNRANDVRVTQALLLSGWRVATVWECALRGRNRDISGTVDALSNWLEGGAQTLVLRGLLESEQKISAEVSVDSLAPI